MKTALADEMVMTSLRKSSNCCRLIIEELIQDSEFELGFSFEEIEHIVKDATSNLFSEYAGSSAKFQL